MKTIGSTKVECYRYDSRGRRFRTFRVDARRLYSIRHAVRYLQVARDVQASAAILRAAVLDGELNCHILKSPVMKAHPRMRVRLDRAALRFTVRQLERSGWLLTQELLKHAPNLEGDLLRELGADHSEMLH